MEDKTGGNEQKIEIPLTEKYLEEFYILMGPEAFSKLSSVKTTGGGKLVLESGGTNDNSTAVLTGPDGKPNNITDILGPDIQDCLRGIGVPEDYVNMFDSTGTAGENDVPSTNYDSREPELSTDIDTSDPKGTYWNRFLGGVGRFKPAAKVCTALGVTYLIVQGMLSGIGGDDGHNAANMQKSIDDIVDYANHIIENGGDYSLISSAAAAPDVPQDNPDHPDKLKDTDADGYNNWFEENVANTDPEVPNDRYVLLLDASDYHPDDPNYADRLRPEYTYFTKIQKVSPDNIEVLRGIDATYENLQNWINETAKKADKNDIVFLDTRHHGCITEDGEQYPHFTHDPAYYSVRSINKALDSIDAKAIVISMGHCGSWHPKSMDSWLEGDNTPRVVMTGGLGDHGFGDHYYPDGGDVDGNGYISVKEMFEQAYKHLIEHEAPQAKEKASGYSAAYFEAPVEAMKKNLENYDPDGVASELYLGDVPEEFHNRSPSLEEIPASKYRAMDRLSVYLATVATIALGGAKAYYRHKKRKERKGPADTTGDSGSENRDRSRKTKELLKENLGSAIHYVGNKIKTHPYKLRQKTVTSDREKSQEEYISLRERLGSFAGSLKEKIPYRRGNKESHDKAPLGDDSGTVGYNMNNMIFNSSGEILGVKYGIYTEKTVEGTGNTNYVLTDNPGDAIPVRDYLNEMHPGNTHEVLKKNHR